MLAPSVEEKKKELLQYRIFENDSDGDVMEGLGNTTLGTNIRADDSSSEENQGKYNRQKDCNNAAPDRKAGQVDKNIIEIAIDQQNRSMQVGHSMNSEDLFDLR